MVGLGKDRTPAVIHNNNMIFTTFTRTAIMRSIGSHRLSGCRTCQQTGEHTQRIQIRHDLLHAESGYIQFDAIYTGYLGSPRQIQIVSDFIKDFRQPDSLIVADPVLGDNGRLYTNFDMEMVKEMRHLITKADVITPNLTELFYLLDEPYKADSTDEELKEYLRLLSDKGPQVVIITSVPVHDEPHKTSVYAYNRQGNRYWKVTCPYLPAHYPGTGDTFTSVITGSLMQGDSLPMALDRATQFILQGIRATFGYEYDNREGILLEKVLHNLDMPIQMASYELI